MSIFNPYEGEKKVDVFQLNHPTEKVLYEAILNNPNCTIIKEEFGYVGPSKSIPVVTVWYEEKS